MVQYSLKQLHYFCTVAESGSFSAAGAQLHVSPSAVAASVTELERILQTRLFVRRKAHGVGVTPAGTHILREARRLLREASELELTARGRKGLLSGPISIGCFSTLAPTVLPSLLENFAKHHPDVQLSFFDGGMGDLIPLLRNASIDLVLTYRINLPLGVDEAVLYETSAHILLPAGHRLAHAETVSLREVQQEDLIMLDLPPSGRHTLDMLAAAGIAPKIRHRTANFELVRSLVARGLGYSVLVQRPHIDYSYEGLPLVAKPISPEFAREAVIFGWLASVGLTARARALVDFALETIAAPRLQ